MSDLYVSASSLKTLQSCPRSWFYKYQAGHKPEDVAPPLVLGRACHASIALWYERLQQGAAEPTEAELVTVAGDLIDEALRGPIPLVPDYDEDPVDLHAEARRMLAAFLATPLRPKRVVAVETPFTITVDRHPVTGERYDFEEAISGVFDLVIEDELGLAIVDHKVVKRRPVVDGGVDLQLALYALAAEQLYGDAARLFHQVLIRTKVPRVELHEIPRVPNDTAEAIEAVASGVELIHVAVAHPRPSRLLGRQRSWRCGGCGYRRRCAGDRT